MKRNPKSEIRTSIRRILLACLVAGLGSLGVATAQYFMPGYGATLPKEQRFTLVLEPGGACQLINEAVMSREAAEKSARMMEKFMRMRENTTDGEMPSPAPAAAATNAPAWSDAELAAKWREILSQNQDDEREPAETPVVEVQGQTVRFAGTNRFTSASALAAGYEWRQLFSGMPVQEMKLVNETNGNLRLAFEPMPAGRGGNYAKQMVAQLKKSGTLNEVRLVMPGRILSSSLPVVNDRTTSFAFTGTNAASLDTLRALMATSIVVVAESGGLRLEEPVDSSQAMRSGGFGGPQSEYASLPLQPASPGYVAEAQSVQVTTLYRFPEGTNLLKQDYTANLESAGVVVSGKLFAPKGRSLIAVEKVRLLSATDDKGRKVPSKADAEGGFGIPAYISSDREDASAQLSLALKLPEPDAKAIEEAEVEAEVVTVGSWKEMEVANVPARAGETVDLSGILAGAKLTLVQRTNKNESASAARMRRTTLTVKLEGPHEIKSLKLECKSPGDDETRFSAYDSRSQYGKGASSRQVTFTAYSMSGGDRPDLNSVKLIVKYPDNLRREKITFKLSGIDLL
jgi:hypothetical protein